MENMANDGDNHRAKSLLFGELWWGVAPLITAGGALLGLEHAGEHVCQLCLRLVFTIWFFYPSAFSLGWNFLDINSTLQRICGPSIWWGGGHDHHLLIDNTSCLW